MNQISENANSWDSSEILSDAAQELGQLYLWFTRNECRAKVLSCLGPLMLNLQHLDQKHGLRVILDKVQLQEVNVILANTLTLWEQQEIRTLYLPGLAEPELQDLSQTISLRQLLHSYQTKDLLEMLARQRVTHVFQPIVYALEPSRIFGHEVLLRGLSEEGALIAPGPLFEVASEAGILPQLDYIACSSAIRQAVKCNLQNHLFLNLSGASIYDPIIHLRSILNVLESGNFSPHQLVFEVVESIRKQDAIALKNLVCSYREAGFQIALDDVGSGYSGLNLIHLLRPDFIKIDMELIRNVHEDPYKATILEKLLEIAQNLEIKTIMEGIESPEELRWVCDHGADFVQGYLISQPTPFPAEI